MITGPIQAIARERLEPRRDERLPAGWINLDHPVESVRGQWLSNIASAPAIEGDSPVLITLRDSPGPVHETLLKHAQSGARVYVLVPKTWAPEDDALVSSPRVLIRRVSEVPVAGVHTASGAHLWVGANAGMAPWRLRLSREQAAAFRQVFLRLFWHEAIDEAYSGGKRLSFQPAGARPFDVPGLTSAAPVRRVSTKTRLPQGRLVHLNTPRPSDGQPSHLWLPPSEAHHKRLSALVGAGTEVRWRDQSLPTLAVGDEGGTLLLSGAERHLQIQLTPAQGAEVSALLQQPGSWSFQTNIRLGDHAADSAKIWLVGTPRALPLEAEQTIPMGNVRASALRDMPQVAPSDWPAPQPLALSARYRWTVRPPTLPRGAKSDPLVGRWAKLDTHWTSRLVKIREALEHADGERGRIGRAFTRLKSAVLGFQRAQSGLIAEVEALDALRPSAGGPAEAPAMLARLSNLEAQAEKLSVKLKEAERKAREDVERERQEAKWVQGVEAARRALPEQRADLTEAEAKHPELNEELSQISEALEQLVEPPKPADQESKKSKKEKQQAQRAAKKAQRGLKAKQNKLKDELTRLTLRIKRLSSEIEGLQATVEAPFVFKSTVPPRGRAKSKKGRFVPASSPTSKTTPATPDEALPEVGQLRVHKNKRYLVINDWAHLDSGEEAAERLKARLVAPEDR